MPEENNIDHNWEEAIAERLESNAEQRQKEKAHVQDEVLKLAAERDQAIDEVKAPLIVFLVTNSKGAYAAEDLQKLPLDVLKKFKSNFADSVNTGYDEILAERERQRKKDAQAKYAGTMGSYNSETGKYENGAFGDEE